MNGSNGISTSEECRTSCLAQPVHDGEADAAFIHHISNNGITCAWLAITPWNTSIKCPKAIKEALRSGGRCVSAPQGVKT